MFISTLLYQTLTFSPHMIMLFYNTSFILNFQQNNNVPKEPKSKTAVWLEMVGLGLQHGFSFVSHIPTCLTSLDICINNNFAINTWFSGIHLLDIFPQ